jgi:hypothetical protein
VVTKLCAFHSWAIETLGVCTSGNGADLDSLCCSVLSKSIHQPSRIFLFLLKTRAIDKEGRSTLRYARASLSALHRASGLFLARYLHPAFRAFFPPVLLKSRLFPVDCPSVSSFAYLRAHHPRPKASSSQRRRSRALSRTRVVHSASACYIISLRHLPNRSHY